MPALRAPAAPSTLAFAIAALAFPTVGHSAAEPTSLPPSSQDEGAAVGRISGRVTDSAGAPIGDALVYMDGTDHLAWSNESGAYLLSDVPVGVHRLRVARLGYAPSLRDVTVLEGATFEVHFVLGAEITVSSAPPAIPDPDGLQIRGRTSDGPDPLVLVNGVAVRGMGATRRDVLAQLDPNDIARIEIISGPAAVTRYGPEAAGGVIQVFLKEP